MSHTWTYDAPSGVYKSHAMSSDLRHAAIAETKFMQFVRPEPGFGRGKGESITITRVSNLTVPTDGKLTENQKIPEDTLTLTTVAITVEEFGRSVPFTSLSDDLSEFNVENAIQRALKDQMKLVMDNTAAAAFKSTLLKAYTTSATALTIDPAGNMGAATHNMRVDHVEVIRDAMYGDYQIPPYEGDDYICLIATRSKRGLMGDSAWEDWHRYTDPSNKFNSEIGRIENIRFIEVNNFSALSNSRDASDGAEVSLGEAVFFGADAVAMAVAQDPELRAKIPQDYGRDRGVAWYGVLQFGLIWDTANAGEAKVIHFGSSEAA